jgi:hypothetical protein
MNTTKPLGLIKRFTCLVFACIAAISLSASDTTRWKCAAYGESYFQREAGADRRPDFIYSHHRNGTAAANIMLLQVQRLSDNTRINIGIMDGTYARANYAAEPRALRHLYEARLAWKPFDSGRTWLEAGVFPSHIGNESAIGMQSPTLSRSLMADNSPYYESGLRWLQESENGKREGGLYLLNGWQRIRLPGRNIWPALGHQLTIRIAPGLRINSSSFVGNPGNIRCAFRVFHNAWLAWDFHPNWVLHTAFDMGWQHRTGSWQTGSVIVQHKLHRFWAFSGRAEVFRDPQSVVLPSRGLRGTHVSAFSVNADFRATDAVMWRVECRWLHSTFPLKEEGDQCAWSLNTALCVQIP